MKKINYLYLYFQKVCNLNSNNNIKILLLEFFLFFLCGCTNKEIDYKFGGLPFDKEANNVAALFTMTDENGRLENLKMMESVFHDGSLGFKYQSYHNKSSKFIYETVETLSKSIGKDGTLLIYLNSHGGGSGSRFAMTSIDGSFKFSKVLNAIADGNKVKRLIVLIDTCHASGGIQEGFEGKEKIVPSIQTGLPELPDYYKEDVEKVSSFILFGFKKSKIGIEVDYGTNSGAYKEALIIASSSAEDLSVRGAFASRLKKAFEQSKENKYISVKEFLIKFSNLHSKTTQKPHYKVLPNEKILEEPLFYNLPIRDIPIIDKQNINKKFEKDYIPVPTIE